MLIKNAKWLNPDGTFSEGAIRIENGKIAELAKENLPDSGSQILDASGMLVLPGAIDPHVHFREPGQLYKEGIASASKAALRGGVTTVIDMPNNNPPCTAAKRIAHKKELFRRKSHVNWGLMLHTTEHSLPDVRNQIKSAKIYMAKSSAVAAITSEETIRRLMRHFPTVSFHAEDETEFDNSAQASPLHHEKRPRRAITAALEKIERALKSLPETERPRTVICHMNTADEVQWLKRMKHEGFDVWGETCPHYLYFTQDDYLEKGSVLQVNPPIRTVEDRAALRQAIADGTIDFMGTDHAPHQKKEKESVQPPSGIAAIEWLLPQMLHLVDEELLSWQRLHELMCGQAASCYHIEKRDGIKVGNYADLVLVQKSEQPLRKNKVQTKAGFDLYERFHFAWRVETVLVNGALKFDGKTFYNQPKGKEV